MGKLTFCKASLDLQGCPERPQLETLLVEFTDVTFKANPSYLTEGVYEVVAQKLIPAQTRQLVLHISNNKRQVCAGIGFCKRLYEYIL